MRKLCKHYVGEFCASGGCPRLNKAELKEHGAEVPESCLDCYYNKQCRDCIFFCTDYCQDEERETDYIVHELTDRIAKVIYKLKRKNEKGE